MVPGRRMAGEAATIVAAALLLSLPLLLSPPLVQDSFWIDWVWTDQFGRALGQGILYPRWLPESFGGLGAPVFDYYAPLAFYLSGTLTLLGLVPYAAIVATMMIGLAFSGAAMRAWAGPGRYGQAIALLYMALPYHIVDMQRRGALAEALGYALLPVVALGVRRAACGRPALLAIGYAALVMSHLPLALLASLFLVAPYALTLVSERRAASVPIVAGLALGLGLAGIFLLPALTLQPLANIDALWLPGGAAAWSFLTPAAWPSRSSGTTFVLLTGAVALPAAALLVRRRERWAAIALLAGVAIAGVVPGLWSVSLLAKVQFPWRLLAVAEFALCAALLAALRGGLRPSLALLAAAPALTLSLATLATPLPQGAPALAKLAADHPDVAEYLPGGTRLTPDGALALARRTPAVAAAGAWTVVRRFDHPRWSVRCGGVPVPTARQAGTGLLLYRGPPGCPIAARVLPAEALGTAISLLSLLALAALPLARRMRPSPRLVRSSSGFKHQDRSSDMADISMIKEHMEVIGADGTHVGTVDHIQGDRIKLTKKDSTDQHHHYVSTGLVAEVEGDKVRLSANGAVAAQQFEESE